MIERAEIANYKSIAHADLNFGVESVIVGQNGVGKSNLIDSLYFMRDAARDGLDHAVTKRHGVVSIRRWSKTRPYNISIKLDVASSSGNGSYKFVIASGGGDFTVLEEEGVWTGRHPFTGHEKETTDIFTFSFKRNLNKRVVFEIPENPFEKLQGPQVPTSELLMTQFGQVAAGPFSYFFQPLYNEISSFGAYSIYPNKIREPQSISNQEVLFDDGTNLASIIRQMRSTSNRGNRESLTSAIRRVLPIVTEIRIESAGGFYVPVFRVKEGGDGYSHDLNMSQISDGTLRMLGMLTAFYQPKAPTKIALEEPEQMIHPGLLPVLLDAARDYLDVNPKRQFITTTHSPSFLDLFEPTSVVGAVYENGVSRFFPLSQRQLKIVQDRLYTVGELLTAEGISE